ncbi:MAG: hypothetical protein IT179_12835 [Acidobacteria bacterium]|nr:hypothetical protein [Acidobacteriota bacterium]
MADRLVGSDDITPDIVARVTGWPRYGAVPNAIADAVGVDAFRRAPVTSDVLLMSITYGPRMHDPLRAHI